MLSTTLVCSTPGKRVSFWRYQPLQAYCCCTCCCCCRHHRYIFEEKAKDKDKEGRPKSAVITRLQELGPRFTLKLQSLQKGTFDSKHGEFEWVHKKEMDTSRRRFHL